MAAVCTGGRRLPITSEVSTTLKIFILLHSIGVAVPINFAFLLRCIIFCTVEAVDPIQLIGKALVNAAQR